MPASALPAAAALLSIPPFRRCVAPGQGGNGAAHYFSSAERVEDGAGVDEHAEREGPGVCVLSASSHPAASWMADMLSTASWLVGRRLYPSGYRRRAVQAEEAKASKTSRYAGEGWRGPCSKGGQRRWVVDVDDAETVSLSIGSDAIVHVEERVAGVPEFEADRARERRARRQEQQRAKPRG